MKLERIMIKAPSTYEKWTGYRGEITFAGPKGMVQIQTDNDLSRRILKECADAIVAASQQVAAELTADVIDQVAALEGPDQ